MRVLLSIKPEFANKIFDGTKQFEFRKVLFQRKNITTIVVYVSSPIQSVIGEFTVDKIWIDSVSKIWEQTYYAAGINRQAYFSYFGNKKNAIAIKIGNRKRYRKPKKLSDFSISHAPQSFVYLEE